MILEEIKNLKEDEYFAITIENEELITQLDLSIYMMNSLENLFGKALKNHTFSDFNKDKVNELLIDYSQKLKEWEIVIRTIIKNSVGQDTYFYITCPKNNMYFYYDFLSRNIMIYKKTPTQ